MKDITSILRSIGLLDSEIKTYMAALEHGSQTALDLAKSTKLSRQAVYTAIESLIERGIMSSVMRGKKRFFAAEHPQKLLAYAKRHAVEMNDRVQDLERSLPELDLQIGGERPTVRMFEGKEGVRAIIVDMEESMPSPVNEITDFDALSKMISLEDLLPLKRKLDKTKTKVKGIYSGTPLSPVRPTVDRHYLPKEYKDFHSNISIYGDKVALVTFEGKMYSVIIESHILANTLRILHELALKGIIREASGKK
jgi:predicted transcriptional regulator